jgi:hypothetical protein
MDSELRYVVVKEPGIDWCRLRRADSPGLGDLQPVWEGNGLRAGYDAMIRANAGRRPEPLRYVCSRGEAIRILREPPAEASGWRLESSHVGRAAADAAASALRCAREETARLERGAVAEALAAVGVPVPAGRAPRLTRADRDYLEWRGVSLPFKESGTCEPEPVEEEPRLV